MNFIRERFTAFEPPSGYAGVLIPLEEAHQHSYSSRTNRASLIESSIIADGNGGKNQGESADMHECTGMLGPVPEYSVEGLRREVRQDGNPGTWSEYEREI